MKTDDLIEALALEPAARAAPDRRVLAFALAGTAAAVAATLWLMGPRPDLAEATGLASFAGKAGYTVMLAAVGFWLLDRLGRPGAAVRAPALALALLALAAVAAAIL
ncbi:MAG: NrsF family protein, partial [Pseudomonadota bacterium]